jgi:REP element-mobilizing transposase RayT
MANTYTQLYFHVVFAVKGRNNLISSKWKEELNQFISGIIANKGQKLMIINGVSNHVHLLIGLKPDMNLSDLIRDVKANSSRFINEKKWLQGKFEWQIGFGAFTLGQSQIDKVINYIKQQEIHHQTKTFKDEYIDLLNHYNVVYKQEYIFEDIG